MNEFIYIFKRNNFSLGRKCFSYPVILFSKITTKQLIWKPIKKNKKTHFYNGKSPEKMLNHFFLNFVKFKIKYASESENKNFNNCFLGKVSFFPHNTRHIKKKLPNFGK